MDQKAAPSNGHSCLRRRRCCARSAPVVRNCPLAASSRPLEFGCRTYRRSRSPSTTASYVPSARYRCARKDRPPNTHLENSGCWRAKRRKSHGGNSLRYSVPGRAPKASKRRRRAIVKTFFQSSVPPDFTAIGIAHPLRYDRWRGVPNQGRPIYPCIARISLACGACNAAILERRNHRR